MHVVLIRPQSLISPKAFVEDAIPPIGLAYLASSLQEAGHRVSGVDAVGEALDKWGWVEGWPEAMYHGLSIPELVARIPRDAELIGVTCMFSLEWPHTRFVLEAIKKEFPDVPLVVGGEHPSAVPDYCLNDCASLDYCILGEGEGPIVQLADALAEGDDVLSKVFGIVGRDNEGQPVRGLGPKRIRAIDTIPPPDWTLFPIEAYIEGRHIHGIYRGRSMPILASRGCPYQCTFCSSSFMWTTLWKARKPENVIAEMKHYIETYNVSNFDFYDLTAIVKKSWIIDFANLVIKELPGITWQLPSGTRSEAIDDEVTGLLFRSGCVNLNYAPESGNPKILKRIKKKVTPEKVLASMRSAVANGLEIKANIMVGFPGETKMDLLHTYKFIIQMAWAGLYDMSCWVYCPYPGAQLFKDLEAEGKVTLNDQFLRGLLEYTDPARVFSSSEHMSDRFARMATYFGMALFYTVSFIRSPSRPIKMLRSVFRREPNTRLGKALEKLVQRHKILRNIGTPAPEPTPAPKPEPVAR